ncbi:MAG: hypothetical protein P8M28_08180, partial [Alphaproteobacteria bacterium]|nr:hypothetical protein [Alphaproteobacteria bacterium]
LRDAGVLEASLARLASFREAQNDGAVELALPAPDVRTEDDAVDREENNIDEDLRYHKAVAELTNASMDGVPAADLPEEDLPEGEPQQRPDPVILPFGRWGGRGEGVSESEFSDESEASVFKFSVPDIVSPNIALNPSTSPASANDETEPAADDNSAVLVEPLPRDPLEDDEDEPVSDLGKRSDRPLFFD